MSQISYLIFMVMIFSSISWTFSAVFFELNKEFTAGDYFRSKPASVHRGLAFSYSSTEKNQMCQDIFYAQLYVIPQLQRPDPEIDITLWVNDGQTTNGKPHHQLIVRKLETMGPDQSFPDLNEIFFMCAGDFNSRMSYKTSKYLVFNGYRSGWWYSYILNNDDHIYMEQRFLISLSPEHVSLQQEKLELQYLNTRQTLEALQEESPDYIQSIDKRDTLLSLSIFRKLFLCASILSSPIYREERLEVSLDWMEQNSYPISLGYQTLKLTFTMIKSEKLPFEGFLCKGFVNGDAKDSQSTSLFITQAYDDKHSVYVVKQIDEHFVLSKYFRNIPLLINVDEPLDEGELFKNYDPQ